MSHGPRVAILMGSASDLPVMAEAARTLRRLGVAYEVEIVSAHRSPARVPECVRGAEERGVEVFVVGAGMAAHLAGAVAAQTTRPVLGVPLAAEPFQGFDALLATVQMPAGVPVGALAVGRAGAANAGVLAAQILALHDPELADRLAAHKQALAQGVAAGAADAARKLKELLGEAE